MINCDKKRNNVIWREKTFMSINTEDYSFVIGYGIGRVYEQVMSILEERIKLDYVMDRRFEITMDRMYKGINVLHFSDAHNVKDALVIVFPRNESLFDEVSTLFDNVNNDIKKIEELLKFNYTITGETLRSLNSNYYKDEIGNEIIFDKYTVSDNLRVCLKGKNSLVNIGKEVIIREGLYIDIGNEAKITIGDGTTIESMEISTSYNTVTIGKDCMISTDVSIMGHDGHHIFDKKTGNRVNFPADVTIGNHVWLGENCMILAGSLIGDGSIIGTRAVVKDSFNENVIAVGVPARIVKKDICWERAGTMNTQFFSHEECLLY